MNELNTERSLDIPAFNSSFILNKGAVKPAFNGYKKEEMNNFMAVNHNAMIQGPSFSSCVLVSTVQSMCIKQVLVDSEIMMTHSV